MVIEREREKKKRKRWRLREKDGGRKRRRTRERGCEPSPKTKSSEDSSQSFLEKCLKPSSLVRSHGVWTFNLRNQKTWVCVPNGKSSALIGGHLGQTWFEQQQAARARGDI